MFRNIRRTYVLRAGRVPDQEAEILNSKQMELLVANAGIGLIVCDHQNRIYFANKAAAELLGYSQSEFSSLSILDLVYPEDQAAMNKVRDAHDVVKPGPHYRRESRYVTKSGEAIWVEVHVAVSGAMSADGEPLYSVQLSPIDRQKQAEWELIKTQQRFEFALAGAQQGVWDYNYATGEIYHSDAWHRIRGMEPGCHDRDDLDAWLRFIHPDDKDRVRDYVERQNAGELDRISFEFRERHEGGHWVWILSRGQVVSRNEQDRPTRVIGTDTDITMIKQSEERSVHLAHRLDLARSIAKTGIWEVDVETGVGYWDDAVKELFGVPDLVGDISEDIWASFVHPEDVERARADVDRMLSAKADHYSQYRVIRPDGETRHLRSRAVYLDDGMTPPRIIGVNWDVTEDVRLTEELQRANELAERRNEELETANSIVEYHALHDALTGLPNRRFLDERLSEIASACIENGETLAVLHVDLDRFKQINDTLGHAAGDAMLMHTAEVLKESVRETDFVARVGGDEFVILLDDSVSNERLEGLARRILSVMAQPISYQGQPCRSGVSIGIATASGKDIDPGPMLVNADIALYRAKSKGRNRFEHFTKALQAEIKAAKTCADEILSGLENDEFFAHYQPQFDAKTLEIAGVEALVRWRHPEQGVLAPNAFLRTAEDLNVVPDIDKLILEKALKARQHWLDEGVFIPRISVNVSTRRLRQGDLAAGLRDMNVEPGVVSFELLESIFLDEDDDDFIAWQVEQLHELGVDIDIDDFGTGHASIVGLLRLNPQRLKIARELVAPITESEAQCDLLRSVIEIGRSLNVAVVAEGVETMAHADLLAEMGCDILQGYAFGRPMSDDELLRYVRNRGWKAVS